MCLMHRYIALHSANVCMTFDFANAWICDLEVSRVVLIGHGQGGLVVSTVLDHLITDLPPNAMSKLVGSTLRDFRAVH